MSGDLAHAGETCRASAAEQIDQECLGQIVGVMAKENGAAAPATSHFGEESITRIPGGSLNRDFFFPGESTHIGYAHLDLKIVLLGELLDETGVGLAFLAAQSVIEMADDKFPVAQFGEVMEQRDRIAATRDTHEVGSVEWKLPENG